MVFVKVHNYNFFVASTQIDYRQKKLDKKYIFSLALYAFLVLNLEKIIYKIFI